ncbi:pectin lyase fold/virulence factor [Kalaharituber pfeilii]|nr:pectin lyase fold/virulence factor [Kalaharituber pfeilii]
MLFDGSTTLSLPFLFLTGQAQVHHRRQTQGDGQEGDPDAIHGDLVIPISNETVVLKQLYYIKPGEIFQRELESSCNEQVEVFFNIMPGGTLRNIIGKHQAEGHQAEGVQALGDAWVENVWWEDGTQVRVIGGGARNATDKIFQDNSLGGKFNITGFYAENSEYRNTCGNCHNQAKCNTTIQNVIALNGSRMTIINPNFGDEFRLKNSQVENVTYICDKEIGNTAQSVPYWIGSGTDLKYCLYNETRDAITGFNGTANTVYWPLA